MKTNRISQSIGLGVGVAFLALAAAPGISQEFLAKDVERNSAVAASPRAQEAFPGLARTATVRAVRTAVARSMAPSTTAFHASPRAVEEFVELARYGGPVDQVGRLSQRPRNLPLAANPRALEDHPELARQGTVLGSEPTFQVAPLK